jgi:hypothetical protein
MSTAKLNLPPLQQGATFKHSIYWKSARDISSAVVVGTTVTIVTTLVHGYTTGNLISIRDLAPTILNLDNTPIIVVDPYTFTYTAPTTGLTITAYSKGKSLKAIDLTGCTAAQHLRETPSSPLLLELSTLNGRLSIDVPTGKISYEVDAVTTAALAPIKGVTDLEVYWPSGEVTRVFEGSWSVKAEVTHV